VVVRRLNRFAVAVRPGGGKTVLRLHLPNSGRMTELLRPGTRGLAVLHRRRPRRRTVGTLLLVRYRRRWVGVDARLPNRLFEAAMRAGTLPAFRHYVRWRPEAPLGRGRVDFLLMGRDGACLVETKSCNRVDGAVALFPDAPTARGARHLEDLARVAQRGGRAAVVWIVQRSDARALRPFAAADPDFARAAQRAAARGVRFYAYACRVTPRRVTLLRRIPVRLGAVRWTDGAASAGG
jgi:sugar fermentation stimulation protein A